MRWQDAHSSLIGKLLLIEGLKKYGYDHTRLQDIRYSKYDRPYLDDLEFNISHSGQYVLCALSNNAKIGVDVEEVRPIDFNDFDRQFTKAEWDVIHSFADPLHGFYNMWTKKEAIVKADGKGLNIPLEDIIVNDLIAQVYGVEWYLKPIPIDGKYLVHLAANVKIDSQLKVQFVDLH